MNDMNDMFIRLNDIDLRVLKRAEDSLCRKYTKRMESFDYITPYQLISCIDDLEDNYNYSMEQISELTNAINEQRNDYIPTLDKRYIDEINKLKDKIKNLEETLEMVQGCLNEDMYDRLADNGYTYYLEKEMGGK